MQAVHVVMKPADTSRNDLGARTSGPRWVASADPFICPNAAWFPAPPCTSWWSLPTRHAMTWVRGPPARVGWRVLTHYLS